MCHNLFLGWSATPPLNNNSGKVVTSVWHIFLERWTCFPVYKIILYHVWWRNNTQLLAICQLGCFQHYLFQYLIKLGEILNSNSTLFQNLTFSLNFEYSAGNIGNILNGTEKAYPINRWKIAIDRITPLFWMWARCELRWFAWVMLFGLSCVSCVICLDFVVVIWSDCNDTVTIQKSKCGWWF